MGEAASRFAMATGEACSSVSGVCHGCAHWPRRLNLDPFEIASASGFGNRQPVVARAEPGDRSMAGDLHVNLRRPGGGSLTVAGKAGTVEASLPPGTRGRNPCGTSSDNGAAWSRASPVEAGRSCRRQFTGRRRPLAAASRVGDSCTRRCGRCAVRTRHSPRNCRRVDWRARRGSPRLCKRCVGWRCGRDSGGRSGARGPEANRVEATGR